MPNIFRIVNPDQCWCRVNSLTVGHSIMEVNIFRITVDSSFDQVATLTLHKTYGYYGPLTWQGANFSVFEGKELYASNLTLLGENKLETVVSEISDPFSSLRSYVCYHEDVDVVMIVANVAVLNEVNGGRTIQVPYS